jgi:D-glycero-D-manno-heptose 1,7-bisphosphate phosphatase
MLMRRQLIELIPPVNQGLDTAFYPELVRRGWLGAHVTRHRYYGPSKPTRLADTEQFFSNPPFVLLDRDGVLNRKQGRGEYVRSWAQWEWLPGALDGLRTFASNGWRVLIVTNQAGVARGALTSESLDEIHARMKTEAAAAGGRVDGIYVCPHGWDEGCSCRKPSPGMLFAAQRDWTLDLSRTWFCGDDDRDREAAEAAGCRFAAVTEDQPLGLVAQRLCGLDSDIQMTRDLIHLAEALPSTGPAMPAADEKEPAWLNASF